MREREDSLVADTSIRTTRPGLGRTQAKQAVGGSPTLTFMIIFAIFSPIILNLGPISLPAPRVMVLLLFIPALVKWVSGKSGAYRLMDFIVLAFASWTLLSMMVVHGASQVEFAGANFLETFGPYLVGRWCIRNKEGFLRFVKIQFGFLIVILPFAILESQTGDPLIIRILASVFETQLIIDHEIRLGLERSQAVFQHPILYGYFAAVTLGLVLYVLNVGSGIGKSLTRFGVIFVSTFLSLSSGPLAGLVMQGLLSIWERITRGFGFRWGIIITFIVIIYIVIDLGSSQTPFHVFVRYLTFNTGAAWNRILIFEYGTQNLYANPVFGIGLNDWARPSWMVSSVDNFWLATGMRHGFPALILLLGSIFVLMIQIGRKVIHDESIAGMRVGVNMSLIGTLFIGATVHLWGPVYIWLWFFLGASIWLLDDHKVDDGEDDDEEEDLPAVSRRPGYTRFPAKP